MAYTKTNWQDLPNTTTPVNATNLNHIETGIKDNETLINNYANGTTSMGSITTTGMTINTPTNESVGQTIIASNRGEASIRYDNNDRTKTYIAGYGTAGHDGYGIYSFETGTNVFEIDKNGNTNIDKYSTNEIKIGKWINGKPIYRKIINFGSGDLNNDKAHGISNIETIVNAGGIAHHTYGWKPLNAFYIANSVIEGFFSIALYGVDGTNLQIRAGEWYTNGGTTISNDSFVFLEYTKTTD